MDQEIDIYLPPRLVQDINFSGLRLPIGEVVPVLMEESLFRLQDLISNFALGD